MTNQIFEGLFSLDRSKIKQNRNLNFYAPFHDKEPKNKHVAHLRFGETF